MPVDTNILIVSSVNRHVDELTELFDSLGYSYCIATSGAEGLKAISQLSGLMFVLCFTDLPDMDSYAFCKQALQHTPTLTLILVGKFDTAEERAKVFQSGATDYLPLPLVRDEVVMRVSQAMQLTDLQAQAQAENELAHLLALVAQETANAVIITDNEGYIEWVNDGFKRMTGYALSEVFGEKPGHILQGPNSNPDTVRRMGDAVRDGLPFQCEILNYHKSGEPYWVDVHIEPIYKYDKLEKFIAIELDITERIQAEEIRREAESLRMELSKEQELRELKTSFVTMVSHEFRTPLAIIRSASETLQRYADKLSDAQRMKRLAKINTQISHLTEMMDDVLIVNQMSAEPTQLDTVKVSPTLLCQKIIERYKLRDISQSIHFDSNIPDKTYELHPQLFEEIVQKLLQNAVIYSPEGGDIHVDLSLERDQLQIVIGDNGIGIPEKDQSHIFTEFYRASNVGNIHGSGLGLTIVQYAVEAHGGSIQVQSDEVSGTIFTVRLPVT